MRARTAGADAGADAAGMQKIEPASERANKKEFICKKAAYSLVCGALAVGDRNQTLLQFTSYHL